MYRLLAIDLDDTLLNPQQTITTHTQNVLHKAINAGVTLVIATGRVPYMLPAALEDLPITAPIITGNGALIIEKDTDTILYERLFPQNLVKDALGALQAADMQWCFYARDRMFIDPTFSRPDTPQPTNLFIQPLANEIALYSRACIKISAHGNAATLQDRRRQFEEQFAGQLHITQVGPEWLEFLHPEVSKASALQVLTSQMGIKAEEVIAIGDNYNDLEMLNYAGLGIAMENAEPAIKAIAQYTTKSNAEDGVAAAIEKFLL